MKNNIKKMVFAALMIALSIIIGWVCKSYFTFGAIRITFENLPILLSGILLGPVYGAVVGVAADIITCLLAGNPINPIITVGAAVIGITSGIFSRYIIKRKVFLPLLLLVSASHVLGSMLIKSAGLYFIYDYALPLLLPRIPLYIGIGVIETYLLTIILKNRRIATVFERGLNK